MAINLDDAAVVQEISNLYAELAYYLRKKDELQPEMNVVLSGIAEYTEKIKNLKKRWGEDK